jgi:psp operon transcriptional activator
VDQIVFDPFSSPWAPSQGSGAPTPAAVEIAAEADQVSAPTAISPPSNASTNDFRAAVSDYERQLLEEALRRNRFNQRATAAALNLSYDQLRHALKRHKLQDIAA